MTDYPKPTRLTKHGWSLLAIGLLILLGISFILPGFFQWVEHRDGRQLNDIILNQIRPKDVSMPIFIILWGMIAFSLIIALNNIQFFIRAMWAYIILCIMRMICLAVVALEPPLGIIELKDPFTTVFYGGHFITKDLFFSGHTATLLMLGFVLNKPVLKICSFIAAAIVGFLLMVQHVHYTIDILAALPFSYLASRIANKYVVGITANSK